MLGRWSDSGLKIFGTFNLICLLLLPVSSIITRAQAGEVISLTIADPFIELHTGPGSGYPIYHVIDRGEKVLVLKQKTSWFRIRAQNGKEGWASKQQMQQTLLPDGQPLQFTSLDLETFINRQWEVGVTTGQFEKAPLLSIYGGYNFSENLSTELTLGHSVGNVSSSTLLKLNLLMQPYPEWSYSPFVTLGMGTIKVKPKSTLINPADRTNQMSQLGFGFRKWLSRRFLFRFELNEYIIFSASNDSDQNEEISEWKLGFAIFF